MKRVSLYSIFIILLLCGQPLHAAISITINGKTSGASFVQGDDTLSLIISGIPSGATVIGWLWIDLDSNGVVSSSTDILGYTFSLTDGVSSNEGDMDSTANGIFYHRYKNVRIAPAHYIFQAIYGTDTASATFTVAALPSPTYTISGTVTKSGTGVANIIASAFSHASGSWDMLTDAGGNYTIKTEATMGEQYAVSLLSTTIPSGYTASPTQDTVTLNANVTGVNFVLTNGTGVGHTTPATPREFSLSQNYPNPFNPTTVIDYQIATRSLVSLRVYDLLGREIATLVNEEKSPGMYKARWDANTVSSGVYLCRLQAGNNTKTIKLLFIR